MSHAASRSFLSSYSSFSFVSSSARQHKWCVQIKYVATISVDVWLCWYRSSFGCKPKKVKAIVECKRKEETNWDRLQTNRKPKYELYLNWTKNDVLNVSTQSYQYVWALLIADLWIAVLSFDLCLVSLVVGVCAHCVEVFWGMLEGVEKVSFGCAVTWTQVPCCCDCFWARKMGRHNYVYVVNL